MKSQNHTRNATPHQDIPAIGQSDQSIRASPDLRRRRPVMMLPAYMRTTTPWTAVAATITAACTSPTSTDPRSDREVSAVLTAGGLAPALLAATRTPAADLARSTLASPSLVDDDRPSELAASPAAARLATGEAGRVVLSVLVACALDSARSITADLGSTGTLTFVGEVGVAPRWTSRPLRGVERRWVTACVLSRLSADSLPSAVSNRGPHPALAVVPGEVEAWSAEEGAFYGDALTDPAGPAPGAACRGSGYRATPRPGGLADRSCAEPDPARPGLTRCGLRDDGDCDQACQTDVDDRFRVRCGPGDAREVITTFVVP